MTLRDLPIWVLRWLYPLLPWLWLIACGAGLVLIVFGGWRRRTKVPHCPSCRYDMRGTAGLECPECGYAAKREKELHRRPRRRRVIAVGVLLLLIGPYVDLVQYRMKVGEPLEQAVMPNTVWVVSYPWWPDTTGERVERRLQRSSAAAYGAAGGSVHVFEPRSDVRRLFFGPSDWYGRRRPPMFDWQLRLLTRRSYAWFESEKRKGATLSRVQVGRVLQYANLAQQFTDDRLSRNRLIAGLVDSNNMIRSACYWHVNFLGERARDCVPKLASVLQDEIDDPRPVRAAPYPVVTSAVTANESIKPQRSPHLYSLERPIGESGAPGIELTFRWLAEPDWKLRISAIHILTHAGEQVMYTPELAERLVDAVVTSPWDDWSHQPLPVAGLLCVNRARVHLRSDVAEHRTKAIRVLGIIFFDGPGARLTMNRDRREAIFAEWVVRVDDPRYAEIINEILALARRDEDGEVRAIAERFLDCHHRLGVQMPRRASGKRLESGQLTATYERF